MDDLIKKPFAGNDDNQIKDNEEGLNKTTSNNIFLEDQDNQGENQPERLMSFSQMSEYTFTEEDFKPIDSFKYPKECINLIQQMLNKNQHTRIEIEDILSHEWCRKNHNKSNTGIIDKGKKIIENLKNFKVGSNWWALALYRFFVHQIVTNADKEEIEEVFKYLDEDFGGELEKNELETGLKKIDPSLTSKS